MEKLYKQIENRVKESKNILLISHRKPDADTLGTAIALKIWLDGENKPCELACIDKPNSRFGFLPFINDFKQKFDLNSYDLIFIVDSGASYMTNFHLKYENLFNSGIPIINIDHHASNDNFGEVNIVDCNAASTTVILYRIFKYLNIPLTEQISTCLLAGIYSDTGSFMHSNTNNEVFKISSELVQNGARVAEICRRLFKNNSVSTLKLWGKVLEEANVTDKGVVISVISEDDYMTVRADPNELSGVIDYLNMVPDTKFAVLINEDRKGNVKGSLRTRNKEVDLSRIAAVFGGGGHPKASGFSIPGKLKKEVRYTIVSDDMSKKSLEF